ncbi:MAG: SiaB family protein kinase [Cyclobacteriaceae bacterium]|nr:SiaB family protein kinase [Cyclobacteriaceae bacterium]
MSYIFDLYQVMQKEHLILAYEGDVTHDTVKSILSMAERNLDAAGEVSSCKRKVFNVMVECLQNMVRHLDPLPGSDASQSGLFAISRQPEHYRIMSGNPILSARRTALEEKLQHVNSLSPDALRSLYKEIIRHTELSAKGGAGLGFVDMIRKSGHPLEFAFSPLDTTRDFFSLMVRVPRVDLISNLNQ